MCLRPSLFILLLALAAALRPCDASATSLDPYAYTSYSVTEGAPADIWTLEQSPTGYLWLGTGMGLYRFDGVRFDRYPLREGQRLPSSNINALKVLPNGDIWLGFFAGGAARLSEGRATVFGPREGMPPGRVLRFASTPDGALWAAAAGGLARFEAGQWQVVGREWGYDDGAAEYVYVDRRGVLWVCTPRRLFFLRPGERRFQDTGETISRDAVLAEDPAGRLWLSDDLQGTRPLPDHARSVPPVTAPAPSVPTAGAPAFARAKQMLFARDGSLWLTIWGSGIWRLSSPASIPTGRGLSPSDPLEKFERADGLASSVLVPVIEDTEGTVWVGTNAGLVGFQKKRLQDIPELSSVSQGGFSLAVLDTGVMVGNQRTALVVDPPAPPRAYDGPVPNRWAITAADGALWWFDRRGVFRREGDTLRKFDFPAGTAQSQVMAFMPNGQDGMWLSILGHGIFVATPEGIQPERRFGDSPAPNAMAFGPGNEVWLAFEDEVVRWSGGHATRYGVGDGLAIGRATTVHATGKNLWVAGENGVARFDGQRFATILESRDLAFGHITGIIESLDGDLWMNGGRGVVQVKAGDIDGMFSQPGGALNYRLFDWRDGLPGIALQAGPVPTAVRDQRGRLWFATNGGVAWLDPAALLKNERPPRTEIQSVRAGDRTYLAGDDLQLPEGTHSVTLRYTAVTLAAADRARFRYRMEGVDGEWHDGGALREATYAHLTHGRYRFRVVSSNGDGVWDETGATLDFTIEPTLVQTKTFAVACVLALLAIAWSAYRMRARVIENQVQLRLEERHRERERIARELHDTLLQGVQGLVLQFDSVARRIAEPRLNEEMERAIVKAEGLIAAARDRVSDLRETDGPLGMALTRAAWELADEKLLIDVSVTGDERPLRAAVRDELLMIAREAMANAVRHAKARSIAVSLAYEEHRLSLCVKDDGTGLDPLYSNHDGKPGRYGIKGMFERARRLGGALRISNAPEGGTEVDVRIQAAAAYADTSSGLLLRWMKWLKAARPG
ncbi:histidine kinase-like protein [Archangium gephyra]|uniref:Histidine kinase-like protein n=1 Tax=Archangium gephyra TaxID=48 RepID=A0AAC8THL0_9BACT|nr:sensor histidine kinase [Archangium gephyra]AKJ04651.1 two-component system sensor kinase [Archangium gephyra]REG37289.1 histidine kinase-like protein [Archangium gephyra]